MKVFGIFSATSLDSLNMGLTSSVPLWSATIWAILNRVSSSIMANRYFMLPLTLTYSSSVLHVSETFGVISSRYFSISPTYFVIQLYIV